MKTCEWCGVTNDSVVENNNLRITLCTNCWEEAVYEAQASMDESIIKKDDAPHLFNFFHR